MITGLALCLTNSSVNFIIYGILNKNFRRSYFMICQKIFRCQSGTPSLSEISQERSNQSRGDTSRETSLSNVLSASLSSDQAGNPSIKGSHTL